VTLAPADSALLDAVRPIRWLGRKRAPAGLAGHHLSRTLGVSPEFTEYREYRQGDDPRRIDWKVLARSDRAYLRLSNDRTVLPTVLVVDASGSLAYPSQTLEKWRHARLLAIGLAAAAHRAGDPVGLLVATATGPRRLPLRARRGTVHDIANALADVVPGGSPELTPLLRVFRSPRRVAIVTDLLGDTDALLKAGAELAASGREVYLVHLVHPAELDPPRQTLLLEDPERRDLKRLLADATRQRYVDTFRAWRAAQARAWRGAGVYYTEVVTDELPARSVRRIVTPTLAGIRR